MKSQHRKVNFLKVTQPTGDRAKIQTQVLPSKAHTLAAKSYFPKVIESSEFTGFWQVHIKRYKRNLVSSILCYKPPSGMYVNQSAVSLKCLWMSVYHTPPSSSALPVFPLFIYTFVLKLSKGNLKNISQHEKKITSH